jgi:photosystem II stability/assembly factor-like uncharacterized protein
MKSKIFVYFKLACLWGHNFKASTRNLNNWGSGLFVLIVLLLFNSCNCNNPVQPPVDTTLIKGTVTDSLTGQALAGTVVSLNTGLSTTTDNNGKYRLVGMGGGSFNLVVDKPDYRLNGGQATVVANDSAILDLKVYPCQWETVTVPLPAPWDYYVTYIKDMCFVNELEGWVVGFSDILGMNEGFGIILHTSDGGYSWQIQYSCPSVEESFNNIDFVDNQYGWTGGREGIMRTTDGGNTWLKIYTSGANSIDFLDRNMGYFVPSVWVYKAINSGDSSFYIGKIPSDTMLDPITRKIKYISYNNGWARTTRELFRTQDGGYNWNLVFNDLPPNIHWLVWPTVALECLNPGYIWVEGKFSRDNGATWVTQTSDAYGALSDASFANPAYGWMSGFNFMIHTVDSGRTWVKQDFPDYQITTVQFLSPRLGWAFASCSGTLKKILIYK